MGNGISQLGHQPSALKDELAMQLINESVYSIKLYLARSLWTKEPPFTSLESVLKLKRGYYRFATLHPVSYCCVRYDKSSHCCHCQVLKLMKN